MLGSILRSVAPEVRARIDFLDIGGGFWPEQGEWLQEEGTPAGELTACLNLGSSSPLKHYCYESLPIEQFAEQIAGALEEEIFPLLKCRVHLEPGRWICQNAMHLLMTVLDKKASDLVIADCGTSAVGRERCDHDYLPVINLSRPGMKEESCWIMGSLCSPHDIWAGSYFGAGIEPGDRLLIPSQGAYTFSLRQNFIKALPNAVILRGDGVKAPDSPDASLVPAFNK
jgi:diaminopimelate decarboxylase